MMNFDPTRDIYACNRFDSISSAPFDPLDYSRLKYGSNKAARKLGEELAIELFVDRPELFEGPVAFVTSPYNAIPNASTVMARHCFNKLNVLLAKVGKMPVDWSIIRRKAPHNQDYGVMSLDQRRVEMNAASFHVNTSLLEGKTIIFVDDVRITGSHEDTLVKTMAEFGMTNKHVFAYYGLYEGSDPTIEARLNFSLVDSVDAYLKLSKEEGHRTLVRPMKFCMGLSEADFSYLLSNMSHNKVEDLYHGVLAEGFNYVPAYENNMKMLQKYMG